MATEKLVWPGPPSLTNGYDAQDYTLGVRFSLVAPQDCSGVVWERTPDSVAHTPTGGQWVATLWNWDTQAIIASVPFTPLAAVLQDIPFGASFPLVNGVNYAATIFTQDYVFLAGGGGDIFTPSLNVAADVGVIGVSSDPVAFPAGQPSSWYFVGPRMEVAGGGLTPFTKDYGLEWRVFNGITKDTTVSWRVLNALTKDTTVSWRVLNAFTKDVALDWRVFAGLSKDTSLVWRVFGGWQADTALAWSVRNAFEADTSLTWRVFGAFTADTGLVWAVLPDGAFVRTYALQWNVRVFFVADTVLRWRVLTDAPPSPLPADVVAYLEDGVVATVHADSVTAYM